LVKVKKVGKRNNFGKHLQRQRMKKIRPDKKKLEVSTDVV